MGLFRLVLVLSSVCSAAAPAADARDAAADLQERFAALTDKANLEREDFLMDVLVWATPQDIIVQ